MILTYVNEEIIFSILIPWCPQDPEPFGGLMKNCRVCCKTSIRIWAACEVFESSLRVSLNVPKMWFLKCWNYAGVILHWNGWRKRTVVHSFFLFNAQSAAEVGHQVIKSQVMVDSLPTLHVALCLKRVGGKSSWMNWKGRYLNGRIPCSRWSLYSCTFPPTQDLKREHLSQLSVHSRGDPTVGEREQR